MSNLLERFTKLKKRVGNLQSEVDKAKGALEGIESQLKEEFDCSSVEEAQTLLEQAEQDEQEALASFEHSLKKFEDRFSSFFDE